MGNKFTCEKLLVSFCWIRTWVPTGNNFMNWKLYLWASQPRHFLSIILIIQSRLSLGKSGLLIQSRLSVWNRSFSSCFGLKLILDICSLKQIKTTQREMIWIVKQNETKQVEYNNLTYFIQSRRLMLKTVKFNQNEYFFCKCWIQAQYFWIIFPNWKICTSLV